VTPLRLAVIGAGHLGRIHARLASSLEGAKLVAVADVSERARNEVAAETGTSAVADFRELVGHIDAAIIATPTSTHAAIGLELLEAGIPVLIEKPLTSNLAEADRLVRLAQSRNVVLQVGHVERFNPAFTAARPLLDGVRYISGERLSGYPARSTDIGVVLDLMIHDLDIVLSAVASSVRRVDALGAAVIGPREDLATARIEFANGCVANLTASRVSYVTRRAMQFYSPAGYVAIDFASRTATAVTLPEAQHGVGPREGDVMAEYLKRRELVAADCNQIADEQREFVASIRGGASPRVPGTAGRDAVALAERVLDSIARHQWDGHDRGRMGPHALPGNSLRRSAA
jgi:predicted dehydrogenase